MTQRASTTPLQLPVQLHLKDRRVVLIGGGAVALWKAEKLSEAGARLEIIALDFLGDWSAIQGHRLQKAYAGPQDLEGAFLVIAATDHSELNARITTDAQALGILALCCDNPALSDLSFPATHRQGPLTVSFATDGISPSYAAKLKREAAAHYGPEHTEALEAIRSQKQDPAFLALAPKERMALARNLAEADPAFPKGSVSLVGAGPGDTGLITLKAIQRLQAADVVVYDALANNEILTRFASQARHIDAGKHKGKCTLNQDQINELLIELAQQNLRVVRLKGGDPCLFGRAGEEIRALQSVHIPYEVIPGISSLSAVPASACIPVTDRDFGRSVGAFSLHKRDGKGPREDEWERMAKGPETLVLFMGRSVIKEACDQLIARGRRANLPAALVINGTLPNQEVITGTLESLAEKAEIATSQGPGLIIVGEVVSLRTCESVLTANKNQ